MATPTMERPIQIVAPTHRNGWWYAISSAMVFAMAGPWASMLTTSGWSAPAAVILRLGIVGALLIIPAAIAIRGQYHHLSRNAGIVIAYGMLAFVVAQLGFFQALRHLGVGVTLLIEFCAPILVVLWLWVRKGARPNPGTFVGMTITTAGLLFVVDIGSESTVSAVGVAWALFGAIGVAGYFLISEKQMPGLPPIALAAGGAVVGTAVLAALCAVGLLPFVASTETVTIAGNQAPWWVPAIGLGVVSGALAYCIGITATRRLGSKLAAFVSYGELVLAFGMAWLLLGELPRVTQVLGGVILLTGVAVVKWSEGRQWWRGVLAPRAMWRRRIPMQ